MIKIHSEEKIPGSSFFPDLFLRKVISRSGEHAGRIVNLHLTIDGLTHLVLLYRFKMITIDIQLVENMEAALSLKDHRLILSIEPYYLFLRRRVYDASGRNGGRVISIDALPGGNEIANLRIRKGLFRKAVVVPADKRDVKGHNILLNCDLNALSIRG